MSFQTWTASLKIVLPSLDTAPPYFVPASAALCSRIRNLNVRCSREALKRAAKESYTKTHTSENPAL
jgi:hypothetical protein